MTKIEINDATQVISLGKGGEISVDVAKLCESAAVVNYIFTYGLKQMLNDVHASEKDAEAKKGLSQKKLDSLYRGEVAQSRASSGDPVAREMKAMAEADVKAKLKTLGRKVSEIKKDVLTSVIEKQLEANKDAYRKAAEAKLAIKPKGVEVGEEDVLKLLDL